MISPLSLFGVWAALRSCKLGKLGNAAADALLGIRGDGVGAKVDVKQGLSQNRRVYPAHLHEKE